MVLSSNGMEVNVNYARLQLGHAFASTNMCHIGSLRCEYCFKEPELLIFLKVIRLAEGKFPFSSVFARVALFVNEKLIKAHVYLILSEKEIDVHKRWKECSSRYKSLFCLMNRNNAIWEIIVLL